MVSGKIALIYAALALMLIVVLGFFAGFVMDAPAICTERACACPVGERSVIDCNSCTIDDTVFFSYALNAHRLCDGKEQITCVKSDFYRRDIRADSCAWSVTFFKGN